MYFTTSMMALLCSFSSGVLAYLLFLLVSGCLAGTFTGTYAQMVVRIRMKGGGL